MSSTSHSAQIRNSHSPSVIALSSSKAPSTAAAKPRFRSRTGCWTCRKRKVKCDERGRNPDAVAYGGLLSTRSGCKRCEDSGRPCHGYGAQPPTGHLITHYPPSNHRSDPSAGTTPFYSFASRAHDNDSSSATFPVVMSHMEPNPCYISHPMQWTRPFEQSLPENQAMNFGFRVLHNPSTSSSASTSLGTSSLAPINQTGVQLPPTDLRRYSVPNYPTWQRSSQPRNVGPYPSGGQPNFTIDQTPSPYDSIEGEPLPPTNVTSAYERPESLLLSSECNSLSADPYQNIIQNDAPPIYNHDIGESDTQSVSFDFNRPHTSSGITLSFDDPQSHRNPPQTYGSPIGSNPKELNCIEESNCVNSTSLPSTTTCTDASMRVWPGPEHQSSAVTLATLRGLSSAMKNHSLNPVQTSLFSAQVNDSLKCQSSESYEKTGAADIPLFPSVRDIPYDVYAMHPSQSPTTSSADCKTEDTVMSVDRCCSDSVDQYAERSLHLFQIDSGCPKSFAEMMSHEPHESLRLNSCSYIRSFPSQGESGQSATRKDSSSSLSSSHSTQEHNLSPGASTTQHPSVKNSCSTTPSIASSPNAANQFYRPCLPPPGLSRHNPTLSTIDWCNQAIHPDRWAPHILIPTLESPPYDFKPILDHKGSEFHSVDAHEDDSPTSTAPSNMSGAPGAT